MLDLVGNPLDRFSANEAHIYHYDNMPWQYTAKEYGFKNGDFQMKNCDMFLVFAKKNRRGLTASTHHLCFRAKIRKIMSIPVNPSFTI